MPESEPQAAQAPAESEIQVSTSDYPAAPPAPSAETPPAPGTAPQEGKASADATPAPSEGAAARREDHEPASKRIAKLTRRLRDQERANAQLNAEKARAEGLAEGLRLASGGKPPEPAPDPNAKPDLDSFDSAEEYAEALADWKVAQKTKGTEQPQRQAAEDDAGDDADDDPETPATSAEVTGYLTAKEQFGDDVDAVLFSDKLGWTEQIADSARNCENPPLVLYQYAKQAPDAVQKLAAMTAQQQVRELVRFEATMAAGAAASPSDDGNGSSGGRPRTAASTLDSVPNAPALPTPVGGKAGGGEPNLAAMSDADYIAFMDAKEAARRR
jgi:hypothetical protein